VEEMSIDANNAERRKNYGVIANASKILAFGDSLTAGFGAPFRQGYPEKLAQLIGATLFNQGVCGEMSFQGARRLPGLLDQIRPDVLLLCHGANDILCDYSTESIARALDTMIQSALSRGVNVLLIAVPRFDGVPEPFPVYDSVADANGVAVEKKIFPYVCASPEWCPDGVHPNAEGYARIAEALAPRVLKLLSMPV
jgi:lysophospholipase L1-like esterase